MGWGTVLPPSSRQKQVQHQRGHQHQPAEARIGRERPRCHRRRQRAAEQNEVAQAYDQLVAVGQHVHAADADDGQYDGWCRHAEVRPDLGWRVKVAGIRVW